MLWHLSARVLMWDDGKKRKINEDALVRFAREMKMSGVSWFIRSDSAYLNIFPKLKLFSRKKEEKVTNCFRENGKNFEII